MTTSTHPPLTLPDAGVGRRLAALFYDSFLIFGLLFIAAGLYKEAVERITGFDMDQRVELGDVITDLPIVAQGPVFQLYLLLVIAGFYLFFWRKSGQTLGMQAWRLKLVAADGGKPGWGACLLRCLVAPFSLALAGIGYWLAWFHPQRLTLHDRLSHSRVILMPKSP